MMAALDVLVRCVMTRLVSFTSPTTVVVRQPIRRSITISQHEERFRGTGVVIDTGCGDAVVGGVAGKGRESPQTMQLQRRLTGTSVVVLCVSTRQR